MTKGEYCKQIGLHFCNPNFNICDEADDDFKADMDKFKKMMLDFREEREEE